MVLTRTFFLIGTTLVIITILSFGRKAWGDDFSGRVVGISDGDTITLLHDGKGEKIRLYGIEAPEKGQVFGNGAKQFVSALAYGKEVNVGFKDYDRYGRTVAGVILPDGRNLNHEIVKAGFAWWFKRYVPKDKELEALENELKG